MKIMTAMAALALTVSLTACGASEAPTAPTPTVTVTAEPTETPTVTETAEPEATGDDELFISTVREEYPDLTDIPDADLIDVATSACQAFDAGVSVEQVIELIMDGGFDSETEGAMAFAIGAGVVAYCPEHTALVEGGIAS